MYKKHHPPNLKDEVWRLEKIGKDGAFHRKLTSKGITTVQEFLKLSVVDPHRLRKVHIHLNLTKINKYSSLLMFNKWLYIYIYMKNKLMFIWYCNQILGIGMSEKMWDVTIKHAKTCVMGNKLYVYRGPQFTIHLNAICQMVRANINGQTIPIRDINNILGKVHLFILKLSFYFYLFLCIDF